LYCKDVCKPLLQTVSALLRLAGDHSDREGALMFVLVSSFDPGQDVEEQLLLAVNECGLSVSEIQSLALDGDQCRVQFFTLRGASHN
jgi:hypothetical protein